MKLTVKIFQISIILLITVLFALFTVSLLLQDKVSDILLISLNKNISTKLEAGSVRLSLIRNFPKASLEIKEVTVSSSIDFNPSDFAGINSDTLLYAKRVSVEFKITDILTGTYNIEKLSLRDGRINLFSDSAGLVNYNISTNNKKQKDNNLIIDLDRISLTDMNVAYNNLGTELIINGLIKSGKLKSRISGGELSFAAEAETELYYFQLHKTKITKLTEAKTNLSLVKTKNGIEISKGTLTLEDWDFGLTGNISSEKFLDLKMSGKNIDLAKIRSYLPENYLKLISEYNPFGILHITSTINGVLSPASNPHIEIVCSLEKGRVSYGKSNISISDLSFTGFYTNGNTNNAESASILISNLKAGIGSAVYSGSFKLTRLTNPLVDFLIKGTVYPSELIDFFDIQNISAAAGSIDLDLKISGKPWPGKKIKPEDIINLNPEANLDFNSFTIGYKNNLFLISEVNGNISMAESITARNLSLEYKNQKIRVNGEFRNLPEWINNKPVKLIASGDVSFNRFIPESFMRKSGDTNNPKRNKNVFLMPDDLDLDFSFKIDSLNYKAFSSSNIGGSLKYRSRLLTLNSLSMNSLKGMISGNGFLVQNNSKAYVLKGNLTLKDIDVGETFKTFNNFGQNFIIAENLRGTLTGSLSILLPLDTLLKPQTRSMAAEGNYSLVNGALINFEPVKKLSSFIELTELENINFSRLDNDFYIRNNTLIIPQMEVKSSAADLSVYGKHNFNNDYEYHVKILLSEILSRKRKKNKNVSTEFGIIEDDGLGRTSLLLKIENRGKEVKVGYDTRAVSNSVKENIKTEKNNLKNLLNQEYGWFKKDSVPEQVPAEQKKRFTISWDDSDSVTETPDIQEENDDITLKNIFKRKK